MGIPHGHFYIFMAHYLLYCSKIYTLHNHMRTKSVSKIMETEVWQSGLVNDPGKGMAHRARIEGFVVGIDKDQIGFLECSPRQVL